MDLNPNHFDHNFNDFGLEGMHLDHLIDFIRGEPMSDPFSTSTNPGVGFGPTPDDHDVFNFANSPTVSCTNSVLNSLSGIETGDAVRGEENDFEAEDSSVTDRSSKKGKVDRSRTLISERKRRGKMKEKLYALRALVPNITKMDKASIVGDAVLYVQQLQVQAKKLKSEIEELETSLNANPNDHITCHDTDTNASSLAHFLPLCRIIVQMDTFQVEAKEFYVRVVSNKGPGVAASLYRALESFTLFLVQSSNLTSVRDQFILTFTLHVGECQEDMNLSSLKLWISEVFLNQGFEFRTSL